MKTKLILVEGIPGSGKTTYAQRIARYCRERGIAVNLFLEGSAHPADLAWNACVPIERYGGLLEKYGALRSGIEANARVEGRYAIVAYTQVKGAQKAFYADMESYEVYDGRVPDDVFSRLHDERWRAFGRCAAKKDELNIFECAFMQNHVNEWLFWRDADPQTVIAHHAALMDAVKSLSPTLIYLSQPDIRETVLRAARERAAPGGGWIEKCIAYVENSPYGKKHGIRGFEGAVHFFQMRKRLEMEILQRLSIPHIVIENPDYDWDAVWIQIADCLRAME